MARRFHFPVGLKQLFLLFFASGIFTFSFGQNPIVTENALTGNPKSEWDISGAGDLTIQGFATDISVNKGETVRFKIDVSPVTTYTIKIYRLGYYQGNGARMVADLGTFTGVDQPNPVTTASTGLIDCSNWSESASWAVPSTAVSGLYIAKLTRTNNGGTSHIAFVVRDDGGNATMLFKTSDATWQAYNAYGGNSLYVGTTSYPNGHAAKVSYNRPFITRNGGGGGGAMEDWFMNAEFPMIRFLERNGYNISYTTDVDMDRRTTDITPAMHKVLLSVGHDEYWSLAERTRFENARNAGVHMAFFSGNEVYWKTRWENNNRTLVCYKEGTLGENVCGNKCDPTSAWTGLWRDGAAWDAGKPENALTGQISWSDVTSAITVPAAYKNLRLWRGITAITSLGTGGVATFPSGTLGYEWDFVQYEQNYPSGYIALSSTTVSGKVHRLSLYRHSSGALVFGAGTVQWSWGLDNIHDRGSAAASVPMQQATVNLFADMGVQPATIMSGLTLATASTDFTAPVVNITSPVNNASLAINTPVTIGGTASDAGGVLVGVEVSVDGGTTWQPATGTSNWTFSWTPTVAGAASIRVRGFDDSGNMGVPGASGSASNINVTIGGSSSGCPCNIWPATTTPATALESDGQGVELGVKFRVTQNGFITGIRFYKGAGNTGTHIGHLWTSTGTQLGTATFINETTSGWQEVLFASPVAVTTNTTYVASYFSPNGFYSSTNPYFTAAVVNGPLRALANGEDGTNGIYIYSETSAFPTNNYQSSNYWVDVVFNTSVVSDVIPPTVNISAPAAGTVSGTINVTANATDNIGVTGVQFLLDGSNLGAEDLSAPYSVSWNTGSIANGSHTLTAVARDAGGNTTTSAAVIVNVNNAPDTQAPTVSVTAPGATTVSGAINVTASASDNVGVAGVQFLLNGANLGSEDLVAPYAVTWNTFTVTNGTYTLTARARDGAGNTTVSASVVVTVSNTSNLIAAYPMSENSGTATADISGNAHNGTLTNAPTWTAGKYGQGVSLDGTNDYISIADHANFTLDPAQSYTWSGWLRNNNFAEWATVWSQTVDGNNFFYFYSHTTTDPDGGPVTNGISVYWWGNGGTNKLGAHTSNNVLTAGQWSHVAITYDASQPQNNRFSIYVNGIDVTVRTDVSSTGTLPTINPTNIRIGSNAPFGEYLNGAVDEFRFYRRLLTQTEVQSDMNTPLAPDLTAPTVSVTAPAAGTVSGTVSVTATASDNVAVVGVQFLLNGAALDTEDLVSPYSISWNTTTVANGNYTLTARARDAAGNITTSAGVAVTVNNAPDLTAPTVSITAPAAGNVEGTINVTANAADNVGVVGVQFLLDGVNLGAEDLTSAYSVSWNTLTATNGNHTLTARARDVAGNTTTSASVVVNVNNDLTAPTVSITAPVAGGPDLAGTVNITSTAADNVGVAGVQFKLNGANLGTEDVVAPYTISWNTMSVTNGNYTLTAVARDAAGNTTTSAAVVVTVFNGPDVQPPVVSIISPSSGPVTGIINITATASDNMGVVGVQFLLNGANLGTEDLSDPYTVSWNTLAVTNGSYTLTARARDAAGNTTLSSAVVVTVSNTGNLIAAYPMNENTGTVAADISGNGHNGTLTNAPTWTTGNYGQGVNLDGTNDYINIADHANFTLDPAQSYTWSGWIKRSTFNEWSTVWSQTVDGNNFFYFYAHTSTDPDGGPVTNGISAYWWGNGGTDKLGVHTNNNVLTAGQWGYVAITYDASQPQNNRFTIYVNGVDVTARGDVSSSGTLPTLNPTNIRIGSNAPFGEYLSAAVDEFRFYKRMLTQAEVQTDMITSLAPDLTSPTVALTAPAAGTVSATVNVTANASDNVAVVGVQFLLNGVNLGTEDLVSPYSVSWNTTTVANGNYTLTARARDAAGNITTSAGVAVTVNNAPDLTAPTVSITAPAAGNVEGTISVTANAADNVGVVGVQFLLDGVNLGAEDLTSAYSVSWNTLTATNGNHTLTARARDVAGNTTTSASVVVNVNNDLTAPTVSITAPVAGGPDLAGTVSITSTAADNVGVAGVQFKLNGANLGTEDVVAPYTISWNTMSVANANYTLTAVARDAAGNTTTSAAVVVTVFNAPDIQPPAVNITSPSAGSVTGIINVSANASDNVGVVGVQFLLNGTNLGAEDLVAPYTLSWNSTSVFNGPFTLTARARDEAGNITTSANVLITVNNTTNLILALNLNEGSGTAAADMSGNSHNGTLTNAPAWGTGKYGQGVNLDGTNDYINIADHANFTLDPAQSYTWSSWLKCNNFNEWSTVWSQALDDGNFFYFYAHTSTDVDGGPVTNGISAYWWTNYGSNKIGVHTNNNVLTVGQWSYVTLTYDASQPQNNRFSIYINGVDVTARGDVASTGTLTTVNPTNIRIGSNQPFGEYINASVDDVRFYRRLLPLAEIQSDMNTAITNRIMPNVTPVNGATAVSASTAVTVVFNLAMDAATINSTNIELRNASNVLVPATMAYNATTRTATLTPSSALGYSAVYSAKVKGGPTGVKDASGNVMVSDYNWSFTTVDPPLVAMTEGYGGPVLVVSTTTNSFSRYTVEILRNEGLNHFAVSDISAVTATVLNNYDVVVLGEMTVTAAQVTLLTNWVNAGGTLIAFRPSALLTPLMGLSGASGTLADRYILVNTTTGPGVGIVGQTMQYHGTANLHTLNGATSLATLYSNATTATSNPAVTINSVGTNGGRAYAFTFDLARSIVYTRQGNPAWAGTKRDGQSGPTRSDDMFFPDWIDFNKVAIPQADEQQRLLANIILQGNLHRKPLPRFWYLPRDLKAAVVMTGDDHANNGTTGRFNHYLTLGPNTPQDVANWNAIRGTSYLYPGTPISNATASAFEAQGFEIALHPTNNCANFTQTSLNTTITSQLGSFTTQWPGVSAPVSNRTHCMPWSDWASHAKVEASKGMRFDVNYYYWPDVWVQNRPGMFTGSGMPMRFADTDGTLIDCYQAVTQMTDESGIGVGTFTNAVLDKALGTEGYYGVFTANMHTDTGANHVGSAAVINSALARQVPVISAKQMLTWLDGRNNSYFGNMVWNNNELSFVITARSTANNLRAMVPVNSETGQLLSITMDGSPVTYTTRTIKGVEYGFFSAAIGIHSYVAIYSSLITRVAAPPDEDVKTTESPNSKTGESPVTENANGSVEGKSTTETGSKIEVRAMPNPSSSYFTLVINSNDPGTVNIRVVDIFGQTAEKYEKVSSGNVKIGQSLVSGTYFVEVIQGTQRKIVKIVKVN